MRFRIKITFKVLQKFFSYNLRTLSEFEKPYKLISFIKHKNI